LPGRSGSGKVKPIVAEAGAIPADSHVQAAGPAPSYASTAIDGPPEADQQGILWESGIDPNLFRTNHGCLHNMSVFDQNPDTCPS
jgi:hypothetical protein